MGSAASGGWENYHVTGKHMSIINVPLNNINKRKFSLKLLLAGREFQILGYWITGSLLYD